MKILVTGGAGFIGSHIVDKYLSAGHEVAVVDNLSTGHLDNLNPNAQFFEVDIRSAQMGDIFRQFRPDVVNHHAAQKSVPYSVEKPIFDADVNLMGLLNLLERSREQGVQKFILASSGGALADPDRIPSPETGTPLFVSPYAVAKYASEKYLEFYQHTYGIQTLAFRYANVYGPRQTPDGEAGVVAIFTQNILGALPCKIYALPGMPRGATRDYVYVHDLVKAHELALTHQVSGVYNLGTGIETDTRTLLDHLFAIADRTVPVTVAGARAGDLARSCLNNEKIERDLGWSYTTSMARGLEETYEWARRLDTNS